MHGFGEHVPDLAAGDPVGQVRRTEQRRRGDDHRAKLHRGQDGLPERRDVAEHEQQPVPAPDPHVVQPVGHLAGARGHLGVTDPGAPFRLAGFRARRAARPGSPWLPAVLRPGRGDDAQCGPVRMLRGDHVEPVERPVELVQVRPGEPGSGGVEVSTVAEQEIARGPEAGRVLAAVCHASHVGSKSLIPNPGQRDLRHVIPVRRPAAAQIRCRGPGCARSPLPCSSAESRARRRSLPYPGWRTVAVLSATMSAMFQGVMRNS